MTEQVFQDMVASEEELRALCGFPSELVNNKAITSIDRHCRDFIFRTPLVFVATSDSAGYCDVSPRGDLPGFVTVIDEQHLVIPERPGNRRFDTLRNILDNPRIGLIFIIPGLEETLRINGQAVIIKDQDILKQSESFGKIPVLGIGVKVEECFIHCAKAFKRSRLWDAASWPPAQELPVPAVILAEHTKKLGVSVEQIALGLKESYEKRLY
ncbi:hypothetical protein SAMN02799630_03379 [Paenibacillus sp. UNCCL117]|uniref:pyridoxamine 5'-phosphate oxidase family protein n=1 Tax=unclassified Paenibacillus TaxID=185978 RepID=UPI00088F0902|nr:MULTISPECIES: pyridoxamine 5'-phosphate oxidase family protein [unclassified Paenibacillus]SDE44298.1 hypothetical protein SAMN04488602_12851 [Paenibacillus sp. cl123]SFW46228.1 hypothetical protein SAMN02799630_03379 [Paenibacillus sp. UNCCL117]